MKQSIAIAKGIRPMYFSHDLVNWMICQILETRSIFKCKNQGLNNLGEIAIDIEINHVASQPVALLTWINLNPSKD